jgi:DNA-binding NarL/FixJ family response regulator
MELARDVASGLGNSRFLVTDIASYWPVVRDFLREAQPGTEGDNANLSSREIEVLRLVSAGKSNQEIAAELVISINTVRRHVSNIFDKTGAANRAQAVAYARDHDLH